MTPQIDFLIIILILVFVAIYIFCILCVRCSKTSIVKYRIHPITESTIEETTIEDNDEAEFEETIPTATGDQNI